MAESLINSIARLRVIEKSLLTKEAAARLAAAPDFDEAVRILRECGWGQAAPSGGDEIDSLITGELEKTYALMGELMPEKQAAVTDVFRMRHDMVNIKLLYKLRMMGADTEAAKLDFGGVYPEAELKAAMKRGDYSMLPPVIASALEELDVITYRTNDPKEVARRVDPAYFKYAASIKNPFVKEYFGALADFTNLAALIRGAGREDLLPTGEFTDEELSRLAEALPEDRDRALSVIAKLGASKRRRAIREGFEEYMRTGHTASIEKARDDHLIALASEGRTEIDTVKPIVGYMLAREREAEVVRLILTAKRANIPMSAVDERSVKLYG